MNDIMCYFGLVTNGPNLKLTAVKGIHVPSLYAKYEVNKNSRFFEKLRSKKNTLFCGLAFYFM